MKTIHIKPHTLDEHFRHDGEFPIPGEIVIGVITDNATGEAWLMFARGKKVQIVTGLERPPPGFWTRFWRYVTDDLLG